VIAVSVLVCRIPASRRLAAQSAAGDVGLTYVPGSSVKVEQLLGDCDWEVKAGSRRCRS
jgi:hypothetical protein